MSVAATVMRESGVVNLVLFSSCFGTSSTLGGFTTADGCFGDGLVGNDIVPVELVAVVDDG